MMTPLITYILTMLFMLMSMAFFTLLERKILGYTQSRLGPNKVNSGGWPQPMADAAKLFIKQSSSSTSTNFSLYLWMPGMGLLLAILLWMVTPSWAPHFFIKWDFIFFFCISSISVYPLLMMGWSSNSKYALLGALRSVAQTISYEVSMILIMINIFVFHKSLNLLFIMNNSNYSMMLILVPLSLMLFVSFLAETNRTPFDFAEGESELVSGFNVEYGGGKFAFIFMAEYLNILFMSMIFAITMLWTPNSPPMASFLLVSKTLIMSVMFIYVRTTYPRMRYDRLMNITWMSYLPAGIMTLFLTPLMG